MRLTASSSAAREIGISIPEDLSVVSGGSTKEGAFFRPRLTTIVPADQSIAFAEKIVNMLVEMRGEPEKLPESEYISLRLVVRESTAPVRK